MAASRFEPRVMFISSSAHSVEAQYHRMRHEGVVGSSVAVAHKFQEPDHPETDAFLRDRLLDEHVIVVKDPDLLSLLRRKAEELDGKPAATVLPFEERFAGAPLHRLVIQVLDRLRNEARTRRSREM